MYSLLVVFVLFRLPQNLAVFVGVRRSTGPVGDQTKQQHLQQNGYNIISIIIVSTCYGKINRSENLRKKKKQPKFLRRYLDKHDFANSYHSCEN